MMNKDYYNNILIDLYFSEMTNDWDKFYLLHRKEFQELNELSRVIQDPKTNDLDRHYLTNSEYSPLRQSLEKAFVTELDRFCNKYSLELKFKDLRDKRLIWEGNETPITSGSDIANRIRKKIFRTLAKDHELQLTTLKPYAVHFVETKSRRKTLERVILGVTDFEFFTYRYDVPLNQKTYLSSFAHSIDSLICQLAKTDTNNIQLVDNLWKLYTNLLTAIEMGTRFTKLHSQITFRKPVETQDPNIYLEFATGSLKTLQEKVNQELKLNFKKEDANEYLCYLDTYSKACEQISTAIESIVPILNDLLNARCAPTPRSGSARRKITAPEPLQKYNATMQEIYTNFAFLASSVKIQKKSLDQILANLTP